MAGGSLVVSLVQPWPLRGKKTSIRSMTLQRPHSRIWSLFHIF